LKSTLRALPGSLNRRPVVRTPPGVRTPKGDARTGAIWRGLWRRQRGKSVSHCRNNTQPTNAVQPSNIATSTNWTVCRPRCCRCHLKSWKGPDSTESRSIPSCSIAAIAIPTVAAAGKGPTPSFWPLPRPPVANHTKFFRSATSKLSWELGKDPSGWHGPGMKLASRCRSIASAARFRTAQSALPGGLQYALQGAAMSPPFESAASCRPRL